MSKEVDEIYEEDFDSDGGHRFEENAENEERDIVQCCDSGKPVENANLVSISKIGVVLDTLEIHF